MKAHIYCMIVGTNFPSPNSTYHVATREKDEEILCVVLQLRTFFSIEKNENSSTDED